MITVLAALFLQQTPAPPVITSTFQAPADLPEAVTRAVTGCVAAQIFLDANPDLRTQGPLRSQDAVDGSTLQYRIDHGLCQMTSPAWTPEGDVMARAVERGLSQSAGTTSRAQWRELLANERGPAVWTTLERRNAEGQVIGVIYLIEPADRTTGEVSISYQATTQP